MYSSSGVKVPKLCDEVRRPLQHPVMLSARPHRIGTRNCWSVHLSDNAGKMLDLLITLTGNTIWPVEQAAGALAQTK
ncbi:hypothetical protein SJI19_23925 [Acerihabitans sp. TG2]|uniref:hypothetical protein n=1 Tax=Acerihabitans sp. TG2 TaxID=3096008 RepID=UPI002B239269|nr:hypothetical protein [Acerihabitans sp. TG2]MEA9393539.1 hypothetical protein [Acerihabitans sp. TG2]